MGAGATNKVRGRRRGTKLRAFPVPPIWRAGRTARGDGGHEVPMDGLCRVTASDVGPARSCADHPRPCAARGARGSRGGGRGPRRVRMWWSGPVLGRGRARGASVWGAHARACACGHGFGRRPGCPRRPGSRGAAARRAGARRARVTTLPARRGCCAGAQAVGERGGGVFRVSRSAAGPDQVRVGSPRGHPHRPRFPRRDR